MEFYPCGTAEVLKYLAVLALDQLNSVVYHILSSFHDLHPDELINLFMHS